jgi:hypothetical protein
MAARKRKAKNEDKRTLGQKWSDLRSVSSYTDKVIAGEQIHRYRKWKEEVKDKPAWFVSRMLGLLLILGALGIGKSLADKKNDDFHRELDVTLRGAMAKKIERERQNPK